jgi:hypothetical protein
VNAATGGAKVSREFLKNFKTLSFRDEIRETGEKSLCHMGSCESGEIWPETMKKPVNFVGFINWATDCMKLIA